jgi:hypothetical protein
MAPLSFAAGDHPVILIKKYTSSNARQRVTTAFEAADDCLRKRRRSYNRVATLWSREQFAARPTSQICLLVDAARKTNERLWSPAVHS